MKCKSCGKNADSEYCFKCKPKKPLSSGRGFSKKTYNIINKKVYSVQNKEHSDKMKKFFLDMWKKKPHYCEISGNFLGNSFSTIYQHHILPKNKYPEACFDEENIIFLTADIHSNVESDMYRYEEINKRRKYLKTKYNLS